MGYQYLNLIGWCSENRVRFWYDFGSHGFADDIVWVGDEMPFIHINDDEFVLELKQSIFVPPIFKVLYNRNMVSLFVLKDDD